jgi:ABC-2 type transport system permease protein
MSPGRALVVAQREYLTRVKSLGFWLATLVLPVFIAAISILPTLFMFKSVSAHRVVVVDESGELGVGLIARLAPPPHEQAKDELEAAGDRAGEGLEQRIERQIEDSGRFELTLERPAASLEAQQEELNSRVLEGELDAWIWIAGDALESSRVEYHAASVSNFITQDRLQDALSAVARERRYRDAGLDPEQIHELARPVRLSTFRVTEEGGEEEGAEAGLILAYALFFLLYMVLVFYGQQVMNGVIEEKSSRIVEVVVSTVRPFELLMGKLVGICCAALTQLAVWLATMVAFTLPGVVAAMAWIPDEVDVPTLSLGLVIHFLLLFLLGFFVFSSLYAAVGSAFNNVQEAQQWAGFIVIFLVAPVLFFWLVINDPDSTVSVVASLIPMFTPLLMMLRIAIKTPPVWQIALGYLLTTAFTFFLIWLSARIYRTGILMYGKKPTLKELWRWVRYA